MRLKFPLFFLFAINLFAQEGEIAVSEKVQSREFNKEESKGFPLKGITIRNSTENTSLSELDAEGISVYGLDVPGGVASLKAHLAPKYLNRDFGPEKIEALKQDIALYYRDHNFPLVAVVIPEQEITFGTVEVNIVEGKLEKIVCKGNRWISDEQITKAIQLEPGDTINTDQLLNNISWLNRTPFHNTNVLLTPGKGKNSTVIELETKERFPLRPYIGGDNTGVSEIVGRARFFGGFNVNNLLKVNDVLSFQYTASSDFSELQSYTIHYTFPLRWKHLFIVYGGTSSNNPSPSQFTGKGNSSQVSGRYTIPFKPLYESSLRELTFGFDWKNTNNNLQFVDSAPFIAVGSSVNIGQFVGSFDYADTFSIHKLTFSLQIYASPGELFPHQSNQDFQELRFKAKNKYVYGRLSVGDMISLPKKFTLATLLRLQMSNQNLLPSEEFGLGGYDTVRGYNERELNVDTGLCYNLEAYAPPIEFKMLGSHQLKFLAFFDYGLGHNVRRMESEPYTRYLAGIGAGVRYRISDYFSSRLDWGFKLHKLPFGDTSMGKLHVGMVLSY